MIRFDRREAKAALTALQKQRRANWGKKDWWSDAGANCILEMRCGKQEIVFRAMRYRNRPSRSAGELAELVLPVDGTLPVDRTMAVHGYPLVGIMRELTEHSLVMEIEGDKALVIRTEDGRRMFRLYGKAI